MYGPNVKQTVVVDLMSLGVRTAHMCMHLFVQMSAPLIRDHYGGVQGTIGSNAR